jgi:hypothetical protein
MVVVALVGSLLAIAVVSVVALDSESYRPAALTAFVLLQLAGSVIFLGVLFPPIALTAAALLVPYAVLRNRKPKGVQVAVIAVAALVFGMGGGAILALSYLSDLSRYRASYPLVSVGSRLDYETNHLSAGTRTSVSNSASRFGPPPLSSAAWTALKEEGDERESWSMRCWALKSIHASTVEQFVQAPGFGVARMTSVSEFAFRNWRQPALPLPEIAKEPAGSPSSNSAGDAALSAVHFTGPRNPLQTQLWDVHKGGLQDFFDPNDLGWTIDRDHVAGFVPHRFSRNFSFDHRIDRPTRNLRRLELVSLLRFGRPVAYATNTKLPQMDELQNTPTRELNAFEVTALESLEKGEELAYAQHGRSLQAVGALRARKTCIKCHEVEYGSLLGAFSYEFLSETPLSKPSI